MNSIDRNENTEVRHFMDDERQISIGIAPEAWIALQALANEKAKEAGWLNGRGSDWDNLNIWVIGRLARCPDGIEPYQWIAQAAK